ncbi:transposase [Paraburkholderia strydomiana]
MGALTQSASIKADVIYRLLFNIAAETLRTIATDARRLGGQIGATLVLYTRGSALTHRLHVHCVVPGGGLSPVGERSNACRLGPRFGLARTLSRIPAPLPRRTRRRTPTRPAAVLRRECGACRSSRLLPVARAAACLRVDGVHHASIHRPHAVVAYLSRYVARVAISDQRLVALDERGVTFRRKDNRKKGRTRYKITTPEAR